MGQKVSPHGLRVGIIKDWDTQWYAGKKDFGGMLKEDFEIRKFLKKKYYQCAVSKITITRAADKISVNIYSARPGVLIGKAGAGIEEIKKEVLKICIDKYPRNVRHKVAKPVININVMEVKRPDLDAQLSAEAIAAQLEKRVSFRRAMRQILTRAVKAGAKGIKTMVSGRLDGAEIARSEKYHEGSIPLQTLRADIDYGFAEAHTTFGVIGVKVWIYKGEVLNRESKKRNAGGGE